MKEHTKKTNRQWYPYEEQGSYFKLEEGVLLFSPMMRDHSRASEEGEVDWENGVEGAEDEARLLAIVKELEHKK
jgi:hypothetical protein